MFIEIGNLPISPLAIVLLEYLVTLREISKIWHEISHTPCPQFQSQKFSMVGLAAHPVDASLCNN